MFSKANWPTSLALVIASTFPLTTLRRRRFAPLMGELSMFQAAPRMDVEREPNVAPAGVRAPAPTARAVPATTGVLTGVLTGRSGLPLATPTDPKASTTAGRHAHPS